MDKKKVKELIEKTICFTKVTDDNYIQVNVKSHIINTLQVALKELSRSDWVSVEDGLPEYGEEVWVRVKDCVAGVRYFQSSRWKPEDRIPYLTYDEKIVLTLFLSCKMLLIGAK